MKQLLGSILFVAVVLTAAEARATGPTIKFSPTSLLFGSLEVLSVSSAQALTISNDGDLPLTISSISVTGDFNQTNDCNTTLAVNASCTVSVVFGPTALGSRNGQISV